MFDLSCSCHLDLDTMTFICKRDPFSLEILFIYYATKAAQEKTNIQNT